MTHVCVKVLKKIPLPRWCFHTRHMKQKIYIYIYQLIIIKGYYTIYNIKIYNQNIFSYKVIINTGWWLGHPSEKYDFVNWDD